ncbi:unnamed protein product [Gadus morhua 'NCC']
MDGLQEFGVQLESVVAVTTDNAANYVNAVERHMKTMNVPCFAHTINLAVRKGLGETDGDTAALKEMKAKITADLNKRYPEDGDVFMFLNTASYLDPRFHCLVQAVSLGCSLSQQVVSSKLSAVWQCLHYEINTAHLQQYQQQQPPHQPPQQKLFNVPMRWRMVIHGGIDGYSRLIVFLRASSNNRSSTVLESFVNAVDRYGVPSRVRTDKRGENSSVCLMMNLF